MKKIQVLVAQDSEWMLRTMLRILGDEFTIVAAVTDGKQLMDTAISLHPDLIVSDVLMPLLTGPQAQSLLAGSGYRIPFVFVSADTTIIEQGPWSIVDKLDIYDELQAAVHEAAEGRVFLSSRVRKNRPAT